MCFARYICNVGCFHVRGAIDPSVQMAEDEHVKIWVLNEDMVVVKAVALVIGAGELQKLVAHFTGEKQYLNAAKVRSFHVTN